MSKKNHQLRSPKSPSTTDFHRDMMARGARRISALEERVQGLESLLWSVYCTSSMGGDLRLHSEAIHEFLLGFGSHYRKPGRVYDPSNPESGGDLSAKVDEFTSQKHIREAEERARQWVLSEEDAER